jgi:predicted RNA-binding Zn ribbon-like protein
MPDHNSEKDRRTPRSFSPAAFRPSQKHFLILGGRLSVDFANTVSNRRGGGLEHWNDLVGFLLAARLIDKDRSIGLEQLEKDSPEGTQQVVRAALELRDSLRSAFEAIATRKRMDPLWVDPINRILRLTDGHDELLEVSGTARSSVRWELQFLAREQRLEWLLAAIARSAAEIISEGPEAPVRMCANPQCGLFFYDISRTGKRRWCSMAVCGNRYKVAKHARRATATSSGKNRREPRAGQKTQA